MTHTLKFTLLAALPAMLLLSSCATLFAPKKSEVVLFGAPSDLKVTENGTDIPIESVQAATKSRGIGDGQTITTYYTSGIKLDRRKPHTIELTSGGKKATLNLKTKVSGAFFVLDLFTTGPLGIIIDASTKKWKMIKPKNIDVQSVLNGTPQRSKGKLKRDLKRKMDGR